MKLSSPKLTLFVAVLFLGLAVNSLAAGPMWMPGFPMRMGTNVMLMWAPIPGATGYNVYRSDKDGDPGKLLISLPLNNHMDMNISLEQSVFYTVKAVMGGAEGEASAVGKLIGAKPLDPPKWSGQMMQSGALNIRWDANRDAMFYNIYKSETKDGQFALLGSVQEPKYVDNAITQGKTYYYQATCVDKNNTESARSPTLEFAVPKEVVEKKRATFTAQPKLVSIAISDGGELGPLTSPGHMFFDEKSQRLYVANAATILALDAEAKVVVRFPTPENYEGKWGTPLYVTVSPRTGNIWSTWLAATNSVKIFNPKGEFLAEANPELPEKDYIDEKREADLEEDRKMYSPQAAGLVFDGEGRLWVADTTFGQVSVYDEDFNLIKRFGSPRVRDNQSPSKMRTLGGLVYQRQADRIIGVDTIVSNIVMFDAKKTDYVKDSEGKPIYNVPKSGSGAGYSQLIKGFNLDADGNLIINDGVASTIQVLDGLKEDFPYKYHLQTDEKSQLIDGLDTPFGIAASKNVIYVSNKFADQIDLLKFK